MKFGMSWRSQALSSFPACFLGLRIQLLVAAGEAQGAAGTSREPRALQGLQKRPPGRGFRLGGNLKLGTNPTIQAPGLELSPGRKTPPNHSRCPCLRCWWGHIQTGTHFRAPGHDLGAEALRAPARGILPWARNALPGRNALPREHSVLAQVLKVEGRGQGGKKKNPSRTPV